MVRSEKRREEKRRKGKTMQFTTESLFIARIYDAYGEVIDYTTHSDSAMLENIVRGDWEGSRHAAEFTIMTPSGKLLVHDYFPRS